MRKTLGILTICGAALGLVPFAGAQSVRHDWMDATAARRDIRRLEADMHRARVYHNFSKVYQDQRLIASDRYWLHKDLGRIHNAGMIPPQ